MQSLIHLSLLTLSDLCRIHERITDLLIADTVAVDISSQMLCWKWNQTLWHYL